MNVVAARVRQAREFYPGRLTQDQLSGRLAALKVMIDRPAITKIELGARKVCDFELIALANALNVDILWLLGLQSTGGPVKSERSDR
ncbi:MAG: helix-turn-helix transcriptional regulator [Verrucomicrobia bacterium]|nr:helix-turn-helix transcriptional regulator [Verrucomicrobiota bacterium]